MHCKQDPIYVFTEIKLRGLVPGYSRNWTRGCAVSFLGIFVSNVRLNVFAVCLKKLCWPELTALDET